jgi:hypothetical protein
MSYTIQNLIIDTLPRVGKLDNKAGITIYGAANSILSLLFKMLLDRHSDLIASGNLSLSIPALGYSASLPSGFWAMAEKPKSVDVITNWMAGTVTSYDPVTGILVVLVSVANGTDTLTAWSIALGALPGQPASTLGTSVTSLAVGTGTKTLTTQAGLSLVAGQYVIISSASLPTDWEMKQHTLEPTSLEDDEDHDDFTWWQWYGIYGQTWEPPCLRPRKYKIIGTTMYVRPKVISNVMITGKYNVKPAAFSQVTDVIPWDGLFDEVFKEGTVRILQTGIPIPEANQDFILFLNREFNAVVNSRVHILPSKGRTKRANFM